MNSKFEPFSIGLPVSQQTDAFIDDLLDLFEREWLADDEYLRRFVARESIESQPLCIAELIRSDIDRRYSAGVEVDLPRYFQVFPAVSSVGRCASDIAFEDYRARKSRGLSTRPERWSWIKGIREADWFHLLEKSIVSEIGRARPAGSLIASATAAALPVEPRIGEAFGDFQLLALLGVGAFSKVYLATQSSLAGRYVALKVVRRSLDEPAHLARLQHTGIVPLYSVHRIGSYTALCMPYAGSATLADWLGEVSIASNRNGQSLVTTIHAALEKLTRVEEADGEAVADGVIAQEGGRIRGWSFSSSQPLSKLSKLDPRNFLLWFARTIADALAHAHDRGIVHGDLKPANILLRNDGEPALIDFNLSQESDGATSACIGGTLPYMSPEQLQVLLGQQFQTNTASDVFSFGIILFEVIENRLPFPAPASTAETDIEAAIAARKERVSITNPNATAGLRAILSKCLEFEPSRRYRTAAALFDDLLRESSNLRLAYASESLFRSRIPKLIRRYPRLFSSLPVVSFCLAIVLVLGAFAASWWRHAQRLNAKSEWVSFEQFAAQSVPSMLSEKSQLEPGLVAAVLRVNRLLGSPAREAIDSNSLGWLSEDEQTSATSRIYDFCLLSAAIAIESWNSLDDSSRKSVRQMLDYCETLNRSSKQSPVFWGLRQVAGGEQAGAMRFPISPNYAALRPVEQLYLARLDVQQDRSRQALTRIADIAEISRDESSAMNSLYWLTAGDAQTRLLQFEAALLSYDLAIAAAPHASVGYVHRAMLRVQRMDYTAAEADYTAAIAISPDAAHYVARALVRELTKDFEGALQDLERALYLRPDSNRIVLIRARINQHLGNEEAVRNDMKRAMTVVPQTTEDWISRGLAQLPRFPDRALRDLRAAEQLTPDDCDVLQNIAHVQAEHLHDVQAALATLNKLLELEPQKENALGGRCVLFARLGRTKESLEDIDTLRKLSDRLAPATIYQIGCAHALLSTVNEPSQQLAMQFIAKALRLGYGAEFLKSDSDLDPIRHHSDFAALITAAKFSLKLQEQE